MEFTEQSFSIKQYDFGIQAITDKTVSGFIAEDTGLGYFAVMAGETHCGYSVTHLASGFGLECRLYSEGDVRKWIEALALLFDWQNLTIKELFALSKEEKDQVWKSLIGITDYWQPVKNILKDKATILEAQAKHMAEAS